MKFEYYRFNGKEQDEGAPIVEIPDRFIERGARAVSVTSFGGNVSVKCLVPVEGTEPSEKWTPLFEIGEGNAP